MSRRASKRTRVLNVAELKAPDGTHGFPTNRYQKRWYQKHVTLDRRLRKGAIGFGRWRQRSALTTRPPRYDDWSA